MARARDTTTAPPANHGREPSFIKHELLRAYLKRLFLIIGMSAQRLGIAEICYVDGFAGPWRDESTDLSSTSSAISLGILDECRKELEKQGRSVQVRALYVEKNRTAFARLARYVRERAPAGVEAKALQGDFVALQYAVLEWCGKKAFAFFFLDPKGWTSVGVEVLKPLLARPQSEFLINFMYDFLSRAASMTNFQEHMIQLLGEAPDVTDLHGVAREKRLLGIYRTNLKRWMPTTSRWPARSAYVRVLDRQKERAKYHLVYLTGHPHGIVVFMQISDELEPVQRLVRASTKQASRIDKTGQSELFEAGALMRADAQAAEISEVERFWLSRLSNEPRKFGEAEFASLLEETDWFPGDLTRTGKPDRVGESG